nr:MAG: hypothetical protein [Microvirus sp.]
MNNRLKTNRVAGSCLSQSAQVLLSNYLPDLIRALDQRLADQAARLRVHENLDPPAGRSLPAFKQTQVPD